MDDLDFWRLCDELTVPQAAALIVGLSPSSEEGARCEGWAPYEQPRGYAAARTAMVHAIQSGKLRATVRHDAEPRYEAGRDNLEERGRWGGEDVFEVVTPATDPAGRRREPGMSYVVQAAPNWSTTTVAVDDLRGWLASRGLRSGFFFPLADATGPDYLKPEHPRYSFKLAAAVSAWLAVDDQPGKTPKQRIERWLRENAAKFGLSDEEGKPNEQGIGECSKVANWRPGGGSPKTPGGNPPTP
jgi:hypothetical protein